MQRRGSGDTGNSGVPLPGQPQQLLRELQGIQTRACPCGRSACRGLCQRAVECRADVKNTDLMLTELPPRQYFLEGKKREVSFLGAGG